MAKISQTVEQWIRKKFWALSPELDERSRRIWGAIEALSLGYGGISTVARATDMSIERIRRGIQDLKNSTENEEKPRRIRVSGGGRKPINLSDPDLIPALESLIEPSTRGNPESPLRWTCKSTRTLSTELKKQGHTICASSVAKLLKNLGYSLQGHRKTKEGTEHPDRNAQFEHINKQVMKFQKRKAPVISVDCKKKELVGDFSNKGREYQPKGCPEKVRVHDFPDKDLGKAVPYGVYDLALNKGWVSVGMNHETAEFAVETIRRWWLKLGQSLYPNASELLITADSGGSNASRSRLWKYELQLFADETGLAISVCHLPPGTSKWNKIEHRMFCHITRNWRGRALLTHQVVVSLISNTTTQTGLEIRAELDQANYEKGIKITEKEMAELNLKRAKFHGDWNYTVTPRV